MRVLIVKLSSLGDVVHAMPAVQDLRRTFPAAQIDWVVERAFAPLVARCAGVRRVIACDLRRWRKAPFTRATRQEWRAFRHELRQEAYDAVIDLQGLSKSALVALVARLSPQGKRYSLANQTEGSSFEAPARWVADVAIEIEPHIHAVERARWLCAAAFKYEFSAEPVYGLHAAAQPVQAAAANTFAPRKPVVALVHGSSRADKHWPLAHWVSLGQRLNHHGFAVGLAHGNAAEKALSEQIAAQLADATVWPAMGLDTLADTLATCAGVIGVDSGLSHVAVALGLPHVQIYNFDTAWRTGPLPASGQRQTSVFAAPCPEVLAVWQAWEALATPLLCR